MNPDQRDALDRNTVVALERCGTGLLRLAEAAEQDRREQERPRKISDNIWLRPSEVESVHKTQSNCRDCVKIKMRNGDNNWFVYRKRRGYDIYEETHDETMQRVLVALGWASTT